MKAHFRSGFLIPSSRGDDLLLDNHLSWKEDGDPDFPACKDISIGSRAEGPREEEEVLYEPETAKEAALIGVSAPVLKCTLTS